MGDGVDGDIPAEIFFIKLAGHTDLINRNALILIRGSFAGDDGVLLRFFKVLQGQICAADGKCLLPHGDLRVLFGRFIAEKHIRHGGDHEHRDHDDGNDEADSKFHDGRQRFFRGGDGRAMQPSGKRCPHDAGGRLDLPGRVCHDLQRGAPVLVIHRLLPPASLAGASSSSARLHANRDATEWIPVFGRSAERTASLPSFPRWASAPPMLLPC